MARLATKSKARRGLSPSLVGEILRRRRGLSHHMARAVVALVRWDDAAGAPPRREAIQRACEAGIDLFLATARESRPATPRELREVAQLGILQARSAQSVEPVLYAYRIAARVAWDAILDAWRGHPDASPESLMLTANYVFTALDQIIFQVTRTYLHSREQHMLRGTRARTRFFHSLISDTFDSELEVRKQALALKVSLASAYVALVIKTDEGARDVTPALEVPAMGLVDATDPHTLVALWPADRGVADDVRARLSQLRARGHRFRAGLGGLHGGLRGISRSYLEAQQAVEVGRKLRPGAALHQHDEVAPYLVLAQNPLVMERYVNHVLGPLLEADTRGVLLPTLEALLTKGSVKEAASGLGLHRHTVLYRMERLAELLDGPLDSPAMRQRLTLALDLRKLL